MQYAGIGLYYLDNGMSYPSLMQLALDARLGTGFSNDAEVALLYQNLAGIAPRADDFSYWSGTIASEQYTRASLAVMAADMSLNASNFQLSELATTGIESLPVA